MVEQEVIQDLNSGRDKKLNHMNSEVDENAGLKSDMRLDDTQVEISEDDKVILKMGYKKELYRGFSAFMSFSFCFTSVAVISSSSLLFTYGLTTGGPVVMVWGWIIGSFFTVLVGLSMGEICSSYPTAGSVYHWSGILASPKWAPFLSYIDGWFNFIGNAAGDASFAFGFAQVVVGAVALGYDGDGIGGSGDNQNVMLATGATVGISQVVALLWAFKNILRVDHQGWFNNTSAIYQMLSTVIIVVCTLSYAQTLSSSTFVWKEWHNETGMDNKVYVSLIGLVLSAYCFSGYEAGAHMSEETKNATKSAPIGILMTCIATACTGFTYIVGMLYAMQENILYAVEDGPNDMSIVNIFQLAFTRDDVHNKHGSLAMTSLLIINLFFAGFSSLTVTSRIAYAMARDGALPFSKFFAVVNTKQQTPIRAIFLVFAVDALLCLLPLGSETAFTAITGVCTIGYQISYAIPIILRLTVARKTFKRGRFHLGPFSDIIGWISVLWLIVTSCLFIFPTYFDENMQQDPLYFNYTCVIVGGIMLGALIQWILPKPLGARHYFKGPKRDDEPKAPKNDNNDQKSVKIQKAEEIELANIE